MNCKLFTGPINNMPELALSGFGCSNYDKKKPLRFPIKDTCKPNKLIMEPLVLHLCWSSAPHETHTGISVFMSLIL